MNNIYISKKQVKFFTKRLNEEKLLIRRVLQNLKHIVTSTPIGIANGIPNGITKR